MTTNKQQIDLPTIPSLPPIEIPEASSFIDISDIAHGSGKHTSRNPSPASLPSQESFMTADTSLYPAATTTNNSTQGQSPTATDALAPPSALRQSISVHSLVNSTQSPDPAPYTNHGDAVASAHKVLPDGPLNAAGHGHANAHSSTWKGNVQAGPSRSRGASISTAAGDDKYESSLFEESDMELTEELMNVARKGKSALRRMLPPGELNLPSRLQTVNSSPTMGKPPPPIVPERSSSLTHKLTKQRSLMSVNTHLPSSPKLPYQSSDITIAVVGTTGCGKSTVIRKGLKSHGLSEATSYGPPPGVNSEAFRYVYRVGRLILNQAHDHILRVLEIDLAALDLREDHASGIVPEGAPPIDGVAVCYDSSDRSSFEQVEVVLQSVSHLKLPTIVFACKADLECRVDPMEANAVLERYDTGLIEVTSTSSLGKEKIRTAFEWMFKAIFTDKMNGGTREREAFRNPASPAILTSPAQWDVSRASSTTPTASSTVTGNSPLSSQSRIRSPRLPTASEESPRTPRTPMSPTRTRSLSDLLSEKERQEREWEGNGGISLDASGSRSRRSSNTRLSAGNEGVGSFDDSNEPARSIASKDSKPPPWMTLDELLDKLLFLAVSDDDPTFISHFLLTYRRFATPRSILLAMQKRMRALDQPSGDPMFACFAQMRICWLLDHWVHMYPNDFAVPGTAGALSALIKSIVGKTYLLHYGSEFIPFMEMLSTLKDQDASWAIKVDDPKEDSDESSVADALTGTPASPVSSMTSQSLPDVDRQQQEQPPPPTTMRERKASLPLSTKLSMMASPTHLGYSESSDHSSRNQLKQLVQIAQQLLLTDPTSIAYEITRVECKYFLEIQPRHWLRNVIGQGGKQQELVDPIVRYGHVSNHFAEWVVSLILCHDKPKMRARFTHMFVEIAGRLRVINNYSALRAVVAGVNAAVFNSSGMTAEIFKTKNTQQFKLFQSYDQLLQATRSHAKYRLALRNSKGPCIPALEIHTSDLIRADVGNKDFQDDDTSKIHWEKFNMIGRFIDSIAQCQQACREINNREDIASENLGYTDQEDPKIRDLLLINRRNLLLDDEVCVLNPLIGAIPLTEKQMLGQRIEMDAIPKNEQGVEEDDLDDGARPAAPRAHSRDNTSHPKDTNGPLKKILFW
ncbi:hypothetical protein NM688_g3048 [Phlebia brevispora]|uniref:Uncharacterized protein n=1 Tax=Phlebia brevispora TaxID=194682 RepID=A0ACC1T720_9APHY|nr:hypothetical protein NM688_g3048 [Phlebia brevispora]